MFTLADVQPQIDADVRFTRHDRRSRPRLFPGLTCGISVSASTARHATGTPRSPSSVLSDETGTGATVMAVTSISLIRMVGSQSYTGGGRSASASLKARCRWRPPSPRGAAVQAAMTGPTLLLGTRPHAKFTLG
jgi:hypothetical protein